MNVLINLKICTLYIKINENNTFRIKGSSLANAKGQISHEQEIFVPTIIM